MFNELLLDGTINEQNARQEFLNKCRIEIERMECRLALYFNSTI